MRPRDPSPAFAQERRVSARDQIGDAVPWEMRRGTDRDRLTLGGAKLIAQDVQALLRFAHPDSRQHADEFVSADPYYEIVGTQALEQVPRDCL